MTKTETKSIKKVKKNFINIKVVNSFLLIIVILCGLTYMVSVNDLIVKGFKLQELKKELNKVSEETTENDFKILSLGSNINISKRAEKMNMIAIEEIDYITVSGGVAMR